MVQKMRLAIKISLKSKSTVRANLSTGGGPRSMLKGQFHVKASKLDRQQQREAVPEHGEKIPGKAPILPVLQGSRRRNETGLQTKFEILTSGILPNGRVWNLCSCYLLFLYSISGIREALPVAAPFKRCCPLISKLATTFTCRLCQAGIHQINQSSPDPGRGSNTTTLIFSLLCLDCAVDFSSSDGRWLDDTNFFDRRDSP